MRSLMPLCICLIKQIALQVRPFEQLARILHGLRLDALTHFSGERSYYLRDCLAELEQALAEYAVDRLTREFGFRLVSVPDLLHPGVVEACGMDTQGKLTQVFRSVHF